VPTALLGQVVFRLPLESLAPEVDSSEPNEELCAVEYHAGFAAWSKRCRKGSMSSSGSVAIGAITHATVPTPACSCVRPRDGLAELKGRQVP
jgi:hypothetical protein